MLFKNASIRVVRAYIDAFNARDLAGVERLLAPECKFIASKGGYVEGREAAVEATRRFFAMPIEFALEASELVRHGDDVLVRGEMRSSDPHLANDSLWRARSDGRHLLEWQSFARGNALPFARLVMPEVARYN